MSNAAALQFYLDDLLTEKNSPAWVSNTGAAADLETQDAWWQQVERQITRLRALKPNWDTYGGQAISGTALDVSLDLLSRFGPRFEAPRIAPLPSGGLQLEWESGAHEVCLEISPKRRVSLFVEATGGDVEIDEAELTVGRFLMNFASHLADRIPRRVPSPV